MEYRLLGPLEVASGETLVSLGPPKQRALLAVLLLHANEVVTTDRLIDLLWGGAPPPTASHAVQVYVSSLRKALDETGERVLLTRPGGYELRVNDDAVDTQRFERLVDEGSRLVAAESHAGAARILTEALRLWQGPPLADFAYEEFAQSEIRRFEELRLVAREALAETEIALGRHREVLPELQRLTEAHPLRESLRRLLMLALYRSGRQAEALRTYQDHRRALGEELGVEPSPRLKRLEESILLQEPALDLAPEAVPTNLPAPLTSFVGRDRELREIIGLLDEVRLLSLTGIGGVGKTRLAIEAAGAVGGRFPDGVWIAELSAMDPVSTVVAAALGRAAAGEGELLAHLRPMRALLVLDGYERVRKDSARFVEQALQAAPGVRVLATGREPLGLRGETVWPVPPLSASSGDRSSTQVEGSDGVRLFMERAAAARVGFAVEEGARHTVATICRRLDGLPLAIELAAAQLRVLSLDQVASEAHDRFLLLSDRDPGGPPRAQTLSTALDWSHESLTPAEQHFFANFAVLAGDVPLEAVEVVCADDEIEEGDVLPLVSSLVDRGLISMRERRGEAYYRMLDLVREYIRQRGEWQVARRKMAYVLILAQSTEPRLRGSEAEMWSTLLGGPRDVVRGALEAAYTCYAPEQASFLAGAAAAHRSQTDRIGFIGGVEFDHVQRFQAGFESGARHLDPGITIDIRYLTHPPDFSGYYAPKAMHREATALYHAGVDVILHAAGAVSGGGLYEAARQVSQATGRHRWAIGADFDEYHRVDERLRPHILASVRLQVPLTIHERIKEAVAHGEGTELPVFDLASHGVDLSLSGGFLDDIADVLNGLRERIVSGEITVPLRPGTGG